MQVFQRTERSWAEIDEAIASLKQGSGRRLRTAGEGLGPARGARLREGDAIRRGT